VLALQLFGMAEMAAGTNYMAAGWFNGRNNPGVPARIQAISLAVFLPVVWLAVRTFGVPGAAGAMLFKILLENALYIRAAEKAGASEGRAVFAVSAAGAAAMAGAAFFLCGVIAHASLFKTVFFMAATAAAGAGAFSVRGFFLRPDEGRAKFFRSVSPLS
jgi:hypothetical protein